MSFQDKLGKIKHLHKQVSYPGKCCSASEKVQHFNILDCILVNYAHVLSSQSQSNLLQNGLE